VPLRAPPVAAYFKRHFRLVPGGPPGLYIRTGLPPR